MYTLIAFIVGVLIGAIAMWATRPKPVGDLRVDHSDPKDEYLFLELEKRIDFSKRKEVCFRVKLEDFIPQK